MITLPVLFFEVEALATRRALELAVEVGIDRITLEGDLEVLINILKISVRPLAQFSHPTNYILYLASHFTTSKFFSFT